MSGIDTNRNYTGMDYLFLLCVFLIPILPRPTAMGPERWVVPVLLSSLLGCWFLFQPKRQIRGGNLQLLVLVLLFPFIAFLLRAVVQGGLGDEALQIASRLLFALALFAFVHWLCSTTVEQEKVYRTFFYGFLLSAALCIFCGVTGIQILEEDSIKASRFFGLHKSTGVFRSFGEFGIMAGVAWCYLLFYGRNLNPIIAVVGGLMILLAVAISQSRNVYFVFFITTGFYFLFQFARVPAFARVSLAGLIILIPIVVEVSMPVLRNTSWGSTLLGTDLLQRNVEIRFKQIRDAQQLIASDPAGALVGFPRQEWRDLSMEVHGNVVAPHNHFVSNTIFLGIIGGSVWILGLYVIPAIALSEVEHHRHKRMTLIILLGTITGLSFYEGFFSCVVMLAVAMAWSAAWSWEVEQQEEDEQESSRPPIEPEYSFNVRKRVGDLI